MVEELDTLGDIVGFLSYHFAIYDAAKMHELHESVANAWLVWDAALSSLAPNEWPPSGVGKEFLQLTRPFEADKDMVDELLGATTRLCEDTFPRAIALSSSLSLLVSAVVEEARRCRRHILLRNAMWSECQLLERMMKCEWAGGANGTSKMLDLWVAADAGPFSIMHQLAGCRPAPCEYSSSLSIGSDQEVRVEDAEAGLLPLADPEAFGAFAQSWHQGEGVTEFMRLFFLWPGCRLAWRVLLIRGHGTPNAQRGCRSVSDWPS